MIECCRKHRRTVGDRPIRQTWGTALQKADTPSEPDAQWLLDIADRAAPGTRQAFLDALARVRDTAQQADLDDAIARGDVNAAMRALGLDNDAPGLRSALDTNLIVPLETAFTAAGTATVPKTLGATMAMRFDLRNPNTNTFLRTYNFNLIRDISDQTREGIRQVIQDAFAMGGHPYEQARLIRDSIGLTANQASAVDNFRNLLVTGDRGAMLRALRDKRFDPTLDRALGAAADKTLTPEQIDRMVSRYRERYIALRATTIARTETLRASNAAMHMAWGQAADKGLLDRTTLRRFWLVTPDDRLCEYCEAVPEMNPNGVALDGYFDTDLGSVMYPPLHPNCRCITFIGGHNGGGGGIFDID